MSVETATPVNGDGPSARRWIATHRVLVIVLAAVVALPAFAYLGVRVFDAASAHASELPDPCQAFVAAAEALPPSVASGQPSGGEAAPDRRACQVSGPTFRVDLEYRTYARDWWTSPGQAAAAGLRAAVDEILRTRADGYSWKTPLAADHLGDAAVGYAAGSRPDEHRFTVLGARRGNAVVLVTLDDYADSASKEGWLGRLVTTAFDQINLS